MAELTDHGETRAYCSGDESLMELESYFEDGSGVRRIVRVYEGDEIVMEYRYDTAGELIDEANYEYARDGMGNWIEKTAVYGTVRDENTESNGYAVIYREIVYYRRLSRFRLF